MNLSDLHSLEDDMFENLQIVRKQKLKRFQQEERAKFCVICLENEKQKVFVPCGHACVCTACCGPLRNCPICRMRIQQKHNVYF
jgi:hypothetical protein